MIHETQVEAIAQVLALHPLLNADEIAERLGRPNGARWDVYEALFANPGKFRRDSGDPPRWSPVHILDRPLDEGLYPWQREALEAWEDQSGCGIVEAVTGAGKTRIALTAAQSVVRHGGRVLVIVPTVDLVRQWERRFADRLPHCRVGTNADGTKDRLESKDVLIATRNAAHRFELSGDHRADLIVVDEVHGIGSVEFRKALYPGFGFRLGLTATLERNDDGVDEALLPYFGSVVFSLGYERAGAEGAIAPFDIALIPVELGHIARRRYKELSRQISETRSALVNRFNIPEEPYHVFMAEVGEAAKSKDHPARLVARRYQKTISERLKLIGASSPQKRAALDELVPVVASSDRALVFTLTIDDSEQLAERLARQGVAAEAIHSEIDRTMRPSILKKFQDGAVQALVTPRVLDEGVDVPEADVGLVVASFRSRRQMIQRMGRLLRPKADGRPARFAFFYTVDTIEDPDNGAHLGFLADVEPAARRLEVFDLSSTPGDWRSFLRIDGSSEPRSAETSHSSAPSSTPKQHARGGPANRPWQSGSRQAQPSTSTGSDRATSDSLSVFRSDRSTQRRLRSSGAAKPKTSRLALHHVAQHLGWSEGRVVDMRERWEAASRRVDQMGALAPETVLEWLRAESKYGNADLTKGGKWKRSD